MSKSERNSDAKALAEEWELLKKSLDYAIAATATTIPAWRITEVITKMLRKYRHDIIVSEVAGPIEQWCTSHKRMDVIRSINWMDSMF